VDAGLGAEVAVSVVAADLEGRGLDPGNLALGLLEDLDPEAPALGVLDVHPHQHLRPVLGLGAAGAGLDVDEAVRRIERVPEHPPELPLLDLGREAGGVALDRLQRRVVTFVAGELEELLRVAQAPVDGGQAADDGVELLLLLAELLGALRIVPDLGILERLGDRV
jgi:hypothetical protein